MLKNQISGLIWLYGRQVGQVMTTNLLSFQNPHVVDTIAAGFSVPIHPLWYLLAW